MFFPTTASAEEALKEGHLIVTSKAFQAGSFIPQKYTCDGKNVSPPLKWRGAPPGTQSFVLVADDPDAPKGTWVHWVVFDIPPTLDMLPEAMPPIKKLANAERQGTNDFKKIGYGGPCPPSGIHRYFFKVYALDTMLRLEPGATKPQVLDAMEGHILAQGVLIGTYKRER